MKYTSILLGLAVVLASQALTTTANAVNTPKSKILLQCTTTNGKQIQLLDQGKTLKYSFGKANTPELVLNVPRSQVLYHPWGGVGRWISDSIDVPNGDTNYSIFYGVDRLTDAHAVEAGVNVEMPNGKYSQVLCNPKAKIISNLSEIDDLPKEN